MMELMLSLAIFSAILLFTAAIMFMTKSAWVTSDADEEAALRLRDAVNRLERDFSLTGADEFAHGSAGTSLAGVKDGDALWFLSPVDPVTETFVQDDDGRPVWQRNILYYLSVPANHTSCAGLEGPNGYEEGCPHKVLVRKVIDHSSAGQQKLLKNVAAYITRPASENDATSMGPGQESAQIVAVRLLWFRVLPDPGGSPSSRTVDLRSVALRSAQAVAKTTPTGYAEGPHTHFASWRLSAQN